MRAVIFDLWETLIDWDHEANVRMHRPGRASGSASSFRERWSDDRARYTEPGAHGARRSVGSSG